MVGTMTAWSRLGGSRWASPDRRLRLVATLDLRLEAQAPAERDPKGLYVGKMRIATRMQSRSFERRRPWKPILRHSGADPSW